MDDIKTTALFALHNKLHAKTTSFAGYIMPLHYPAGMIKEHQHTRTKAGLFDISHMGQLILTGNHCAAELEKLVPSDIQGLKQGSQRYTVMTNESGGIIDDLIIANLGTHYSLIVNAARKEADIQHLQNHLSNQCQISLLTEQALLALQGPLAKDIVKYYAPELENIPYMSIGQANINNIACTVSRSGYTGEDGFEISVSNNDAINLAQTFLSHPEVAPVGLGARDSLRLEAGLCLYGHELTTTISPVEANLSWLVTKQRIDYPGAAIIREQLHKGAQQYRVGIQTSSKSILRQGTELHDKKGNNVGFISSGSFGASLLKPVAMAYVKSQYAAHGTELYARQRAKEISVCTCSLPFVKHQYFR